MRKGEWQNEGEVEKCRQHWCDEYKLVRKGRASGGRGDVDRVEMNYEEEEATSASAKFQSLSRSHRAIVAFDMSNAFVYAHGNICPIDEVS
jgi:hypothetical protein